MNPYDLLGLKKGCTDEEITKAFRELSKTHHPDIGGDAEVFIQINIAVSVLRDPYKRRMYDDFGIWDGMSEDNTNQMVQEKFQELINSWVDNQLQSWNTINIVDFFQANLSAAKRNINRRIDMEAKSLKDLKKMRKLVKVKEGRNIVLEVIQARINSTESSLQKFKEELHIVSLINEETSKYSTEDDSEEIVSRLLGSMGHSTSSTRYSGWR